MATTTTTTQAVQVASVPAALALPPARRERKAWHLLIRNRMAMAGAAIVVAWVLIALLAPVIGPLLDKFAYVCAEGSFIELYEGQVLADDLVAWLRERELGSPASCVELPAFE